MKPYHFSRRAIARCKCLDCGINVIKAGDYCMLNPAIWDDQLHLGWHDNLCIACVEVRIGRRLGFGDLICLPSVEGFAMSGILSSRIIGDNIVLKCGELVERNSRRGRAEIYRRARRITRGKGDRSAVTSDCRAGAVR
jgi:hypothetical protein